MIALPEARGVRGHLKYTWALVKWFADWRGRIRAADDALREAVDARDAALVALGEAAARPGACDVPEVERFAVTAEALRGQARVAEERALTLVSVVDRSEADMRAELDGLDAQLDAARRALQAEEVAVAEHRRRAEDAQRRLTALEGKRAAEHLAELEQLRAGLRSLGVESVPVQLRAEATRRRIAALVEERALTQHARAVHLEGVRREREGALRETAQLLDRRRAALADLGREVMRMALQAPTLTEAVETAQARTQACEVLRDGRRGVLLERSGVDLVPALRSLAVLGGLLLGLLLLWVI